MDIQLDAVDEVISLDLINNGVWHHFRNPKDMSLGLYVTDPDGKPILDPDGKPYPCEALVRSYRSKEFQKAQFAGQAKGANGRKNRSTTPEELITNNIENQRPRNFTLLLLSVRNLSRNALGQVITPGPLDKLAMAKQPNLQWMVEQVINWGFDETKYGIAPAVDMDELNDDPNADLIAGNVAAAPAAAPAAQERPLFYRDDRTDRSSSADPSS